MLSFMGLQRVRTVTELNCNDRSTGKESTYNKGDLVQSLGWEDPLEKGKATHSSILACRIPWTV